MAIGHYYFGYIHPFYDGNGRTSRFISSMFLSKTLGVTLRYFYQEGLINLASKKLKNDSSIDNKDQLELMFVLAQNNFFDYNDGLTVQELAEILNLSEATTRKIAKELLDKSLIKQLGVRPAYFYIDIEYFKVSDL